MFVRLQTIEWKNRDLYALLRHAEAVSDKSNRRKKAEEENVKVITSCAGVRGWVANSNSLKSVFV